MPRTIADALRCARTVARTLAAAGLFLSLVAARADVVLLTDGGKVVGEVVEETPSLVVVQVSGGRISVDRARVVRIDRTEKTVAAKDSVRTGTHFRVKCDFAADAIAEAALAAAEAAWVATSTVLGAPPDRPGAMLEIRLYRRRRDFEEIAPAGIVETGHTGFADVARGTAHLLLQPECDVEFWRRMGPTRHLVLGVAHEAAHLVSMSPSTDSAGDRDLPQRNLPQWLSEGLAEHVAAEVVAVRRPKGGLPSDFLVSTKMSACLRLREEGLLPDPRAIVQGRLDHLGEFDRYAVQWAFFEVLLEPAQRVRTNTLLAQLRDAAADEADLDQLAQQFVAEIWGRQGQDELCAALRRRVDAFAPQWLVQGPMDLAGDAWLQWCDRGAEAAQCWRLPMVEADGYRISGSFEVVSGNDAQVEVSFGATQTGGVSVVFSPSRGVTVEEFVAADESRSPLEGGTLERRLAGQSVEFEVEVGGGAIRVKLGGREALSVPVGDRDLTGFWGVGTRGETVALWRDVVLR